MRRIFQCNTSRQPCSPVTNRGGLHKRQIVSEYPQGYRHCLSRGAFVTCSSREVSMHKSAFASIFELTEEVSRLHKIGDQSLQALSRVIDITHGYASCQVTRQLRQKFGVEEDNRQLVVCVTEKGTGAQVWWNKARTLKPQTFKPGSANLHDPTHGGSNCDFCRWETLTACDTFGRAENNSCVTASNLFKFAFPCHGLILFKHHHPLHFSSEQVADLLSVSAEWFQRASAAHQNARWPLFLWNCLPRAGASQFHGHAQTILTETPSPAADALLRICAQHLDGTRESSISYPEALQQAYSSIGLLRSYEAASARAVCYAPLAPTKDMEVIVMGCSLLCPAFARLLHGALRALIDGLGAVTFNVGILNIQLSKHEPDREHPLFARIVSRGAVGSQASDFGGLEVFGKASIGHTDPYVVMRAVDALMKGVPGYSRQ